MGLQYFLPVPFKQVALTDPLDDPASNPDMITHIPGPMLFRGVSESDTPPHSDDDNGVTPTVFPPTPPFVPVATPAAVTNACPVIIRGFVPLTATKSPVLMFTFERVTAQTGGTWLSSDGLSPQNAPDSLYAEKAINPSQLSNLVVGTTPDPVKGYPFQVRWNQHLSRTSVTLGGDGKPNTTERWIVRAYAIYNEAAPVNPAGASLVHAEPSNRPAVPCYGHGASDSNNHH